MGKHKEIVKLKAMLDKAKIPYQLNRLFSGYHLFCIDKDRNRKFSVMQHDESFGSDEGLIEVRKPLTNRVALTAEEVFERIKKCCEGGLEKC